jgi:hypothetical protein
MRRRHTCCIREFDPNATWSISDRLQMLAFEAELAHLPRSLIIAIWESLDQQNQSHVTRASSVAFHPLDLALCRAA